MTIEPRHDAPPCKCGGPLQPSAYADGMLRPELPAPWTGGDGSHGALSELRCAACGDEIQGAQTQVLLAWYSVGAHEQHIVHVKGQTVQRMTPEQIDEVIADAPEQLSLLEGGP